MTIIKQLDCGEYTVLGLDSPLPDKCGKYVKIGENKYEIEIVYDLPNSIAIKEKGRFVTKSVEFPI